MAWNPFETSTPTTIDMNAISRLLALDKQFSEFKTWTTDKFEQSFRSIKDNFAGFNSSMIAMATDVKTFATNVASRAQTVSLRIAEMNAAINEFINQLNVLNTEIGRIAPAAAVKSIRIFDTTLYIIGSPTDFVNQMIRTMQVAKNVNAQSKVVGDKTVATESAARDTFLYIGNAFTSQGNAFTNITSNTQKLKASFDNLYNGLK